MNIYRNSNLLIIGLGCMLLLSACSSSPDTTQSSSAQVSTEDPLSSSQTSHPDDGINDPLEGFNRAMWQVNYGFLDPYFVRPVSIAYMEWTPWPLRRGLSNFLSNLDEPASLINSAVMGNGQNAYVHFNRFWINSIFGLLGVFDIASIDPELSQIEDREFGDVLGHYGVGNGPYVMIPGYGPWTPRQLGDQVDGLYQPLSWLNWWQSIGKWAVEGLEARYALIPQESMLDNSPDPYALSRNIFLQRRDYKAEVEIEQEEIIDESVLDEYLNADY